MALNRLACPECGAGLKSSTGFTIGQTVSCPKCETYFVVEEPSEEEEKPKQTKTAPAKGGKKPVKAEVSSLDDEDDEEYQEERPKKKKKKKKQRSDDDEDEDEEKRSYKSSPLRFVILGILVITMLVLGYFLYEKRMKENKAGTDSPRIRLNSV